MKTADAGKKTGFAAFLERKNIQFSPQRYGIDALSAMAQGLFASLLIGTIISTLGKQLGIQVLQDIGGYASSATGPAMAVSIGYALQAPPLVLFTLAGVGIASRRRVAVGTKFFIPLGIKRKLVQSF